MLTLVAHFSSSQPVCLLSVGLEVEEMSSVMESYASDGNDPITTTHITRYDPDPLPTTTSTTTTTTR